MIEDFTYNIALNHNYPDLQANYKVIVADTISHDPGTGDLLPLYTIIQDDDYTGANFSIYDSMSFNSQTDYFHRLHACRFPVSGCFSGIKDGSIQYAPEVLQDNDLTPVPAAPIIVRLSVGQGTPDYRTPVVYENGVSVVLKAGTTTVDTKVSQSIIPDPNTDNLNAGFIIFPAVTLGDTYTLNFTYDGSDYSEQVIHSDKNGSVVDLFLEQLTAV